MDNQELTLVLKQLHSIHLPNKISSWPPAPIYYLIFTAILGTVISLFLYKKYQKKTRSRKFALAELNKIKLLAQAGDDLDAIQNLSILLRQCALTAYPRENVAALHGQDWLEFLDDKIKTCDFTNGAGQIIISAPFQKNFDDFPFELITISHKWIKKTL